MHYSHDFTQDPAGNRQDLQEGGRRDTSFRWHIRENHELYQCGAERQTRGQPEARDQEAAEVSRPDQDMGGWQRGQRQGTTTGAKKEDRKSRKLSKKSDPD